MDKEITLSYKAKFLMEKRGRMWFLDCLGISNHTLNRRLVENDWKKSEDFVIDYYYKIISKLD
jgi:hypothetical protein